MHHNDEYVLQALKSGASGYLLKRAATAELPAALKSVVGGEIYLSREIASQFLKKFPLQQIARSTSPLEQLTPRQREILQLLAEGQTTKAIASILKVSDKTVEYHRAKLMARLKIFDIPGLVRFALRTGLVSRGILTTSPSIRPLPGVAGLREICARYRLPGTHCAQPTSSLT